MSQLVVITGPIASGKSVVATALAGRLRDAGLSIAIADLDDTVAAMTIDAQNPEHSWEEARELHSHLVGTLLSSDVDVVIAHGPFYSRSETEALMREVPAATDVRRVMLLCAFEVALTRVAGDTNRGLSKDPVFLRSAYERFVQLLPGIESCDWTLNSATSSVDDIATTISEAILQK